MISKWAYILIGDNNTGKTKFQEWIVFYLTSKEDHWEKLINNSTHDIEHRESPRKLKTLFTINKSIQEMQYGGKVDTYFEKEFKDANICILSSHSSGSNCVDDIINMIHELQNRYYNVCAVFFNNCNNTYTKNIAQLNWKEIIVIRNPKDEKNFENQIKDGALFFSEMLIKKSCQY